MFVFSPDLFLRLTALKTPINQLLMLFLLCPFFSANGPFSKTLYEIVCGSCKEASTEEEAEKRMVSFLSLFSLSLFSFIHSPISLTQCYSKRTKSRVIIRRFTVTKLCIICEHFDDEYSVFQLGL